MEKTARAVVVPVSMAWSDVGDWHGLGELIEHDGLGNSVRGDFLQLETRDSVVWSETGRMVAALARCEGLEAHARSALVRLDDKDEHAR